MELIKGKEIAQEIREEIREQLQSLTGRKPCLAVIIIGEDPPSQIYVRHKIKACEAVGFRSILREFQDSISQSDLLDVVKQLNQDPEVDGILVQLPLPKQIDPTVITLSIDPTKDVDGFHPLNLGKMMMGEEDGFIPCTPLGIKELLIRSNIEVTGKHAVIVGRSNIVGKPMATLLSQNAPGANATVTVVHSKSKNMREMCGMADLLIVAIGKPKFITAEMVKSGACVIDVGMNQIEDPTAKNGKRVVGDVDFENVKEKCSFITPVPKGVGPMTIAMLMYNTLKSYRQR